MKRIFSKPKLRDLLARVSRTCGIAAALILVTAQPVLAESQLLACPTCKNGLHDGAALGYAVSVIFMMSMPFAIMIFWALTIYRLRAKMLEMNATSTLPGQDRELSA